MATNNFEKEIKEFESVVLSKKIGFSGVDPQLFTLRAGRLNLSLSIVAITGTLNLVIQTSIDADENYVTIFNENYSSPQTVGIPLTDVHQFFQVVITVTGGTATYMFGGTGSDNSSEAGSVGLVPEQFNEIEITTVNGAGDPTQVVYRNGTQTVATLDITYDLNGNPQLITRS